MKNWNTRQHQQMLQYKKEKKKWDKQRAEYLNSIREAIKCPTASTFLNQIENKNDTSMKEQ